MTPQDVQAYHRACQLVIECIDVLGAVSTGGDWTRARNLGDLYDNLMVLAENVQATAPDYISIDHKRRFATLRDDGWDDAEADYDN